MSTSQPLEVTVSRVIEARPETIYDLISDITQMHRFSPENTAGVWLGGATGPAVGERFKGNNSIKRAKWSTKPIVTAADRGRQFAFKVPGKSGPQWTYRLQPIDGGTRVTESMVQTKRSPLAIRMIQRVNGVTDRAAHLHSGMTITLDRLASAAIAADQTLASA